MEPPRLPAAPQPFQCWICRPLMGFSSGKALALHMQEKHEPNWTQGDRDWLKSIRIKIED